MDILKNILILKVGNHGETMTKGYDVKKAKKEKKETYKKVSIEKKDIDAKVSTDEKETDKEVSTEKKETDVKVKVDEKVTHAKVMKCNCESEMQDKLYGKGNRVHNKTNSGYRCTVCSNEKK